MQLLKRYTGWVFLVFFKKKNEEHGYMGVSNNLPWRGEKAAVFGPGVWGFFKAKDKLNIVSIVTIASKVLAIDLHALSFSVSCYS